MKKGLIFLTVLTMIAAGFTVTSFGADKTITGLGTGTITNPDKPEDKDSAWSGNYVYYGKYDGEEPTKYRVLDKASTKFGGTTLFLDCDSMLYIGKINEDGFLNPGATRINEWAYSDVKAGLSGNSFLEKEGNFSSIEKDAIVYSTVDEHALEASEQSEAGKVSGNAADIYVKNQPLNNEKVFLLDVEEASNIAYGYTMDGFSKNYEIGKKSLNRIKTGKGDSFRYKGWLLRSAPDPTVQMSNGSLADDYGTIRFIAVNQPEGVSPAFNVDLSSVMFSSRVQDTSDEYKLTLSDNDLKIALTGKKNVTRLSNVITVPFMITNDKVNDLNATRVSVLVTDKPVMTADGAFDPEGVKLLQYGKLAVRGKLRTVGTGTFELDPEIVKGKWGSDYHVYILAENENGEKETDYASLPCEIEEVTEMISRKVTFKVVNGSWDDGSKADKTVTLKGYEGDTLKLASDEIPSAGKKPDKGYKAGSWDIEPKADTAVSENVIHTYTYEKKSEGDPDDPDPDPDDPGTDPDNPAPKPAAPKAPSENAIEAMGKGFASSGDTASLTKNGKRLCLNISSDCELTVVKGNSFFISDMDGRAEFDKQNKKLLSISKKGKVSAKKPADDLRFGFNHKIAGKKIMVSLNIIEPAIVGGKKLKARVKAGEAFDLPTTIPLNAVFGKVKNKGVAENLVFSGEAAIGADGKLHIKGTAKRKGKITIPFTVYGKKFKAVITVKQ